jgi:Tfp pilus assembly protein PilV
VAHRPRLPGRPHTQRGFSLIIGLVMLVLLTLFALSAFNVSNVNLRIAGNMQVRQETLDAAQTATEQVMSTPAFISTPPADKVVKLNGASYTVKFKPAPTCVGVVDVPSEDLDAANSDDLACIPSAAIKQSGVFVAGTPMPPSYCSNTKWEITAQVVDTNSGSDTTLTQGVAVRTSKVNALTYCP